MWRELFVRPWVWERMKRETYLFHYWNKITVKLIPTPGRGCTRVLTALKRQRFRAHGVLRGNNAAIPRSCGNNAAATLSATFLF